MSFFRFYSYSAQPYGRNWGFLWNVNIPKWQILFLVIAFFIGVWAAMLFVLKRLSKTHTWLLPVFAVGLGAPRWCQVRLFKLPHDAPVSSPDFMGHVFPCSLHSLGTRCRTVSGRLPMALVGCAGCYSRGWFRNDSPTGMVHHQKMPTFITIEFRHFLGCTLLLH
jgi:hypothetical protein